MKRIMKKPKNDQECKDLLKSLPGRTNELVDGIMDFGKLAKAMENEPIEDVEKTVGALKKKWTKR